MVAARRYVPVGAQTANKADIPLIQTPQSISVITRDQIDLLNFIDGQQAVRYTSGVQGENYGPDLRFDFVSVRGFTPKQYIDGLAAPITTTIYSVGLDLYAFDSMDILKGPASVLYGSAPPGGIYNQTSRRASSAFGGELAAQYGTTDYKQVAGTITGAISDNASARITGLYRDREADRDGVTSKRALAAPTVTFKLGDSTTLTGLSYYQHDQVDGDTNGFLPAAGTLLSESARQGRPQHQSRRARLQRIRAQAVRHRLRPGARVLLRPHVPFEHQVQPLQGRSEGDLWRAGWTRTIVRCSASTSRTAKR